MFVPWRQKALLAVLGSIAVLAATLVGGPAGAVSGGNAAGTGLGYVAKLRNSASSCTGVLISPSWVLTAGGCFGASAVPANGQPPLVTTIVVGRNQLNGTGGHQVLATRVIPNPTRDLVLVGLNQPVNDVTPARLSTSAPAAGQALTISSFGRTADQWMPNQLQSAPVAVTAIDGDSLNIKGGEGTALCRGDAGAPAVRTTGGVADVVGLGSTSKQGGCLGETETTTSGVLSRVDGLEGWISARTETSGYVPLSSTSRVFDSRNAIGVNTTTPLAAEQEYVFQVLGVDAIPLTNVSAVMLDLSVHDQTTYTQTKLWADGTTQPAQQGLVHNKAGVEPLGNSAVIPVGANGKMRLWHAAGTAHVVVDVQGYFTKTATSVTAGGFVPMVQTRAVDTRNDIGTTGGAIAANGSRIVSLADSFPVPSGTATYFASVALFSSTADGFLRLLPGSGVSGIGGPDVSFPTRTFSAGTTINVVGGVFRIDNHSAAPVQVVIDIQGSFSRNAAVGGGYHYASARVLDTRAMTTRLLGGTTIDFQVTGVGGIPATGVTAVAMNLHSYKTGQDGNALSVWPTGATRPAAIAHYQPGNNAASGSINRTSLMIIPTGTDGKISVRNTSATETDVYIELEGWFQDQPAAAPPAPAPDGPLTVEDFSYPGAAEIERTQNVHLISGDGNIVLVACSTPAEGDVGVIRVRTTETIGDTGNGLLCFKVLGTPGHLDLEVPAVYEIRGDGTKAGAGHEGTAKISTDTGVQSTVAIAPAGSVQIGVGADPDNEPTTLLQLNITG